MRCLIQSPRPTVDGPNACPTQFRILDPRYLLIGTVHEFRIPPVPIHIFAAIRGMGSTEDPWLRLFRHACPSIAGDSPSAHTTPTHATPGVSFHDPLAGAVSPLHHPPPLCPGFSWQARRPHIKRQEH